MTNLPQTPLHLEPDAKAPALSLASEFVVSLAGALHRQGMACHHLESLLERVAAGLGLDAQILSFPTAFIASFSPPGQTRSTQSAILRLDPGNIDLTRQSKLVVLARQVADGTLKVEQARARIAEIEGEPGAAWWVPLLAGPVTSGAASRLFGGGLGEMILASAIGLLVVLFTQIVSNTRAQRMCDPLAAILAAVAVSLSTRWLIAASPTVAVLGGLVTLLPGYTFTVGLDELSARHWVAGTARLAGALSSLLFLGLSVLVAGKLAGLPGAHPLITDLPSLPAAFDFVVVVAGLVALSLWFRAPTRDLPWVVLLGGTADLIEVAGAAALGVPLAASLAALVLAISCNAVARLAGRVANAVLAPALMLLVPGSLGLRSLFALSEKNVLSGVESAYQMVIVAVAIVTGLLLGNIILPSRKQPG